MKAKLVYATNVSDFNQLLMEAIDLIEASGNKVDGIELRYEHDSIGHREYIAFVTSGVRVNNAPILGELLTYGEISAKAS